MNILYLAHRIPYPPNKGDKIRSFQEVKYFSEFADVFLAALVDDPLDMRHVAELRRFCKEIRLARISRMKKKIYSFTAFYSGMPLSIPYFYERDLQVAIDELLSRHKFDAVVCFSSPMAEYIFRSVLEEKGWKRPRMIMDFCDVDSAKWNEYAKLTRFPFSQIYGRESRLLKDYERRVAESFDRLIFVSKREQVVFESITPHITKALTIPNSVDLEYFTPSPVPLERPLDEIVFTGAMDYYANIDGVCWFAERIWPRILAECPNARFMIVGSRPSKKVQLLNNRMNIHVTGYVQDMRPYYEGAHICVVPLRIARGVQNKVLEALAMEKPVVCTPQALEGISATPGRDLMVAATEEDFVKTVVGLLNDRERRRQLGENGRRCVKAAYGKNAVVPLWRKLFFEFPAENRLL
ncbi:MAG: TIGR03087 family PEP-CTERM/XrtA system glycosyltransferase [Desulfobacteraceae bacterium]|nr:MAG: TIGR03087 family PEP-CTERM/XrtA system glycosyltransferase [Desulfobacteraceae bacterium]